MKQLFIKTDKKFIAGLPRFKYEGRIVVIQSEAEAERAVAALEKSKILGIDTETRPSFRKGVFHQVANCNRRHLLSFSSQLLWLYFFIAQIISQQRNLKSWSFVKRRHPHASSTTCLCSWPVS